MNSVETIFLLHIALIVVIGGLIILIKGWKSTKQYFKFLFTKREIPKCEPPKNESASDQFETRPVREPEHWAMLLSIEELQEIRLNIIKELIKMKSTDWGAYALRFICSHSPKLANMMVNGEVNLELIQNEEMQGIKDTIDIVQRVDIKEDTSLRTYFRRIFKTISKFYLYDTNRKFYYYGRERVLDMLRMYKASEGVFTYRDKEQKHPSGLELTGDTSVDSKIINKIQKAIDLFEKADTKSANAEEIKEYFRYRVDTTHPHLEFDLDLIDKTGNFKYQGSLVNALFLELKRLLKVSLDEDDSFYYASEDALWDYIFYIFPLDDGSIELYKIKGAVDYYPDRLYVVFSRLTRDHWAYKWLKSYKMFLEGND